MAPVSAAERQRLCRERNARRNAKPKKKAEHLQRERGRDGRK